MSHIVICSLLVSTFFHIISQAARFSGGKKGTEYEINVVIFSTNFVGKFLILRTTEPKMIKKINWSSCKGLFILD